MPTSYTSKLVLEGQTFRDFALRCARAFLHHQIDEPTDAPPRRVTLSERDANGLNVAHGLLANLKSMSEQDRLAYGASRRRLAVESAGNLLAKQVAQNCRLTDMALLAAAWEPPSRDHEALRKFMLEQIETSMEDTEYAEQELSYARTKGPEDYYAEAVSRAERDVARYAERLGDDGARAEVTNEWIDKLYASLEGK